MAEVLTNVTVIDVSETNSSFSFVGGTFTIGNGPLTDLTLSAQDDDTDFSSLSTQPAEARGSGRQTAQVTDDAGNEVAGVASLQQVLTLTHPDTGETIRVGRIQIREDDGSFGNGAVLTEVFIFDGPIDPNVTYDVTAIEHSPGNGPGSSYSYSEFADDGSGGGGAVCFAEGTLILTKGGYLPIEHLAQGAKVQTVDGGLKEVLWHGTRPVGPREMAGDPTLRPIRLAPGAVGNFRPLLVSQQHRIALDDRFVKAKHLPRIRGLRARIAGGVHRIVYHHLLLEEHGLLLANGTEAESLFLGPIAQDVLNSGSFGSFETLEALTLGGGHSGLCRPELKRNALVRNGGIRWNGCSAFEPC